MMAPTPPYDWPEGYPRRWVWTGWDGINRHIDQAGRVVPPFPSRDGNA